LARKRISDEYQVAAFQSLRKELRRLPRGLGHDDENAG
jgi:hypothetical protein